MAKWSSRGKHLHVGTTPITPAPGNVHTNFGLSTPFGFQVTSPYGTDGRTDGQTDGRARRIMRPVGRARTQQQKKKQVTVKIIQDPS